MLNAGFSNATSSVSCSLASGVDLASSQLDASSLLHFIQLMNDKVKPRLSDRRPIPDRRSSTTRRTTTTEKPLAPEPYVNSFHSRLDSEPHRGLDAEHYRLNLTSTSTSDDQVLLVWRENSQRFRQNYAPLAVKLYRHVLFVVNMSPRRPLSLDRIVRLPMIRDATPSLVNALPQLTIHVLYDSSSSSSSSSHGDRTRPNDAMPEYVHLNSPEHEAFFALQPGASIVLEY